MVKCPFCSLVVRENSRAIECDCCAKWVHLKCTNMSLKSYKSLTLSNDLWLCQACRNSNFPFNTLEDSELLKTSFNCNISCHCSKNITKARLQELPQFDIISSFTNGILCRLRHHIPRNISIQLYYSLLYPFLTYGVVIWGNTYDSAFKPISILQKKTVRIMTFSRYDEHSSPLFKALKILKLADVIHLQNAMLLYNYHSKILPTAFDNFFQTVASVHQYNTRLASRSSYYIPYVNTNYGKFNIRYRGAKIWNALDEKTKSLPRTLFKNKIMIDFLASYI